MSTDVTYLPATDGDYAVSHPSLLAVIVDGRAIGAIWRSRNNKRGSWRAIRIDDRVSPGYFRSQDAAAVWLREAAHRLEGL